MNRKFFVVLMSSLFIFACEEKLPTVDSSTSETYKDSLDRVSQSVPKEKEENFNFSISILAMESIKKHFIDEVIMTDDEQDEQGKKEFQKSLHGLNYKQIMSRSDQVMKSKMERAKEQYEEELMNTIDAIVAAKKIKTELSKIIITDKAIGSKNLSMKLENKTHSSLKKLLVLGLVAPTEDSLPNPRVLFIDFEKPLAPKEARTVVIPLKGEYGWKPTDYLAIPRISLDIVRAEDVKKKVILNDKLAEAFGGYVDLRKNYQELQTLLEGQNDWVSVFTVENIAKGFFPLK